MTSDGTNASNDAGEPTEGHDAEPGVPEQRKRSRLSMQVPDETLALYSAARGFLLGEWFGALLIVASFSLLYWLYAKGVDYRLVLAVSLGIGLLGTAIFWRSRKIYRSLGFDYAKRSELIANVVAASGAIFWGLFALLMLLVALKVPVLPAGN